MEDPGQGDLTQQTVDIVSAYVANNNVRTEDLANLINTVRAALSNSGTASAAPQKAEPPMPWKKAVRPDFIISFEDGKQYKSMKRHLTRYGLTPEQYREKWGLPRELRRGAFRNGKAHRPWTEGACRPESKEGRVEKESCGLGLPYG